MKRKYKTKRKYPCPYCDKKMYRDQLIIHVGEEHESMLPEGYSPARAVYDSINKKNYGTCMVCKAKVYEWDPVVLRYKNICSNPACINAVRTKALNNHLDDPQVQMKMLAGRKISGTYEFADGTRHSYVGSYEKKCLEFMDKVLQMEGKDILTPGPVVDYEYEGEKHTWILDILYVPAMLAIDCKDGGDNPNTREMKSYREKQKVKEDAIEAQGKYNYLRLTDNNFAQLLTALADIKFGVIESDPDKGIYINESTPGGAMIGMAAHQSVIVPRLMRGMNTDDVDGFTFGNTMLDRSIRFDQSGNIIGFDDDISKLMKRKGKKILLTHRENVLEGVNSKDGKAVLEAVLGHPFRSYVDFLFCEGARTFETIKPDQEVVNESIMNEYYEYLLESSDEPEPTKKGYYDPNGIWNSLITRNGKSYRERAEVLLIKDGKIYIKFNKDGTYDIPGGSTEPQVKVSTQATRECEQEAHITPKNLKYKSSYYEDFDHIDGQVYVGFYSHIFTGEYGKAFNGYVRKNDRDPEMLDQGHWYDIDKVWNKLKPVHKQALKEYYENILNEAVMKSEKDIYWNKDKFDSGEINLCFITGLSGYGKSTMAKGMNVVHCELDKLWFNDNITDEDLKKLNPVMYSFFTGSGKKYRIPYGKAEEYFNNVMSPNTYAPQLINAFVEYCKRYAKSHKNTKFVVEGTQLYNYVKPESLKDYAVYIKGTSVVKSRFRAARRDAKDASGIKDKFNRIYGNFSDAKHFKEYDKEISSFRNYFSGLMKNND